ncbi:MAG: histidine kinase N-terminal 7TM domain-containing protein [Myxococcota bacterium]|nr:histidine kinase N-terminal 7TM domain-containing protein [Myxococcota bacterium]
MPAATAQAAATLLITAALAFFVAVRSRPTPVRRHLLGLLAALGVWSGGVMWRYSAADDAGAWVGYVVMWAGIAATAPAWLLLAARYARVSVLEERPRLALLLFVPSLVAYLGLVTNPWHHRFLVEFSQAALVRGPWFYAHLAWAYSCVLAGNALYLLGAHRMMTSAAWRRGLVLAAAAALPLACNALYLARIVPLPYDPTPTVLGLSTLVLTAGVFRFQLFEALPPALRDVIDHLRDGILITDARGICLDANPAAGRILGCALSDLRGRSLGVLLESVAEEPTRTREIERAFAALAPDHALPPIALGAIDARSLELTAKCLSGPGGEPAGRFAALRDRTQERKFEHFVRQSQKLETVGSLVAGVAHEVNNPLAFVRSNLGYVRELCDLVDKHRALFPASDAADLADLTPAVEDCLDGIDRIARIVDGMRRFTRIPDDELGRVDLNATVREAMRLAELHRNRSVRVVADLDDALPLVHGSSQRLMQVFLNLLVNAKQALADQAGGRVEVLTRLAGDIAEVEVRDNGPGIPPGVRHRVFDPFFTTKGPEEGTGLGLSIAFDIVREHGGVLELRPDPAGGACFVAHLPAAADAGAPAGAA